MGKLRLEARTKAPGFLTYQLEEALGDATQRLDLENPYAAWDDDFYSGFDMMYKMDWIRDASAIERVIPKRLGTATFAAINMGIGY